MSWKILATFWNFFGGVVKTVLLVSMEPCFNFLENMCFSYRLRTFHEKKVRLYVGNFPSGLAKLFSNFHRNTSKKSVFQQKIMSLFNSFGKLANSMAFLQKKIDRAVKTAYCVSIGSFWGKRFLRKNFGLFIIFGLRANFSQFLSNNF